MARSPATRRAASGRSRSCSRSPRRDRAPWASRSRRSPPSGRSNTRSGPRSPALRPALPSGSCRLRARAPRRSRTRAPRSGGRRGAAARPVPARESSPIRQTPVSPRRPPRRHARIAGLERPSTIRVSAGLRTSNWRARGRRRRRSASDARAEVRRIAASAASKRAWSSGGGSNIVEYVSLNSGVADMGNSGLRRVCEQRRRLRPRPEIEPGPAPLSRAAASQGRSMSCRGPSTRSRNSR